MKYSFSYVCFRWWRLLGQQSSVLKPTLAFTGLCVQKLILQKEGMI